MCSFNVIFEKMNFSYAVNNFILFIENIFSEFFTRMEELKLRKIFIFVLISIFLLPTVTTTLAQSYEPSIIENGNIKEFEKYTFEDILSLEPYIQVEDGFLVLNENDASEAGIDSILIKGQQEYFIF